MDPFTIAAIGSSVLGLYGAHKDRQERNAERERLSPENVRKEFEEAGFNPLLGVGAMMQPVAAPSAGMTQAMANAGNALMYATDQKMLHDTRVTQLEKENENLKAVMEQQVFGMNRPSVYQELNNGTRSRFGDRDDAGSGDLYFAGYRQKVGPETSNAEDYEARYGDWASNLIGFGIAANDIVYHVRTSVAEDLRKQQEHAAENSTVGRRGARYHQN